MRVLTIIHTMGHGGAENIFRWLAWGLKQRGVDVVAGIPRQNDRHRGENWIGPALDELGIAYEVFEKRGSAYTLFSNLRALIKRVRPDIVHSHLLDSNFYSSLASKTLRIPHISTEHGDVALMHGVSSRAKFVMLSAASDAVICVAEGVRRLAARLVLSPSKLRVIHNGVQFGDRPLSTFRREYQIPDRAILVGSVGNLYPVKGHRYLIAAFARFLEVFPEAYLVLVGRGDEMGNLRSQVKDLRLPEDRVIFTGFRPDVPQVLAALDLYVQPSLSEGFPVAVLEAMALGVPVVATGVGGLSEILGNNEHGLIVPPGSVEAIFHGLIETATRMDERKSRAARSMIYVRDQFSVERMTARYLETYREILKN